MMPELTAGEAAAAAAAATRAAASPATTPPARHYSRVAASEQGLTNRLPPGLGQVTHTYQDPWPFGICLTVLDNRFKQGQAWLCSGSRVMSFKESRLIGSGQREFNRHPGKGYSRHRGTETDTVLQKAYD
ncbi:uncharacterized protein LOC140705582 [Pogona vitticeps]